MEKEPKEPKSIWKRPWKGRRAVVFWFLIVPIAAFFTACLLTRIASLSTPLFRPHPWFGNYVESVFALTLALIIAIALVFAIGNFILWVFPWLFHWRNLRRVLFVSACLATVIALFYAEEDWRGKHDWEKLKRQWEAKGENFDKQSVLPKQVPDDQNFAMSPVWVAEIEYSCEREADPWYGDRVHSEEVSNYFRLLPMWLSDVVGSNWASILPDPPDAMGNWRIGRTTDLRSWQSFYRDLEETNSGADISITPQPQTPAQDVLLALSKYDPLIERLRRDSQLPYSRFPIRYHPEDAAAMAATLLPHLGAVKPWAMVLELRAIAELRNRQSDKALEDVNLIFRLADANRAEPFVISHLVRAAVLQIALQPIYEGLAGHEWSDAQLAELDSELSNFDLLEAYRFSMHSEMILFQQGMMDYLRHHPREIDNLSSDSGTEPKPPGPFVMTLSPGGWFYQNELRCIRSMEDYYLPAVDTSRGVLSPSSIRRAEAAVDAETRHENAYNMLEGAFLPPLPDPAITFAYGQNSVNLARLAIALERFHLAHGQYPDSLGSLSPQFITLLPHDVINGQPLHYRRTADGQFVLYSVGWNETDDGGVVVPDKGSTDGVDRKQGDWVWRYPEK